MSFVASQAPSRHVSPVRAAGFHHRAPYVHGFFARAPKFSATATVASTTTSTVSTKDHLSNLERFLLKQIPQRQSQQPNNKATGNDPPIADYEAQATAGGVGSGGRLLHALNLQRLIPNPTEEMSPKSLARLHRLLSDTPRPSPRNSLASRWKYYHGAADWKGLLDPFDENLRRELVRYGDLVGAAYHAFQSLPEAQPGRPRQIVLPDRSYRVTSSLYATSSLDLPSLGPLAAPPWMSQRSSWVGYVAVCDSDREIQRMGRRDIVISLRGTATLLEWAENFRAGLVPMSTSPKKSTINDPKVECGFWSLFKTSTPRVPSLAQSVVAEVKRLIEKYKGEELSISITGHSLGAALGVLVADELAGALGDKEDRPSIAVFSFGGPKVGNVAFAKRVEARGVKVLRVVNANDVITKVPANAPAVIGGRQSDVYAHVGQELRLDNKSSPFLKPDAGPACCHDLEAYLHLVDGFLGSGCPFRANAKRSIARLMDQQRTSVKRLYVSKAHSFAVRQMVDPIAAAASAALASPST